MLSGINRQANAYDSLYHGQTLALKVSGAEIESADFPKLASDITSLNENGVNIALVFGGGEQINRKFGRPRPKVDGVAVTNDDVLRNGVLPAYDDIRRKLAEALPHGVLLEPKDLRCDFHPDTAYGLVGIPKDIVLPDAKLVMTGFVGSVDGVLTNVNADDIARLLVEQYSDRIEELLFLTNAGGVVDAEGRVVSLLTEKRIDALLAGTDGYITVDGGMKKKMIEVRRALEKIAKVVITKTSGLQDEIEKWMGSGTLCVDSRELTTSPMRYIEEPIFDEMYAAYVAQDIFRPRSPEELVKLKTHHQMLRANHSPLGGLSLVPRGDWVELSGLWAGCIGNGIGQMLLESALKEAGRRKLYAVSANQDSIGAFTASGLFRDLGPVSRAKSVLPPDAPKELRDYDTTNRDPHVFIPA